MRPIAGLLLIPKGGDEMYVKQIVSLTDYLAGARRDLSEICRHLVLDTFKALNPRSIYLGEIVSNGSLRMRSSFGFDELQIERWGEIPLNAKIPVTESISRNKCIVIPSKEEFFQKYPAVRDLGEIDTNWNSAIAVPIFPFGAFFLVLHGEPKKDGEFEAFLRTIGNLLALSLRQSEEMLHSASEKSLIKRSQQEELTTRQKVIVELLAKGYTNVEISKEIGYSESLIRQETIAIYAFMGVSGRKELIRLIDSNSAKA